MSASPLFPIRAWYRGKLPPDPQLLQAAESTEPMPSILYQLADGSESGDYVKVIVSLREKLRAFSRDPAARGDVTPTKALQMLLMSLVDFAPSTRAVVSALDGIGSFQFAPETGDDERKQRIWEAVSGPADEVSRDAYARRGSLLSQIWAPEQGGLLERLIQRPGDLADAICERLEVSSAAPLVVMGYSFSAIDDETFEGLSAAGIAAYGGEGVIHLLSGVPAELDRWDSDPEITHGPGDFGLLETLLLHEIIEVMLDETAFYEPLEAHVIASTFERCLRDSVLAIAVEAFYLDWSSARAGGAPPADDAEAAEATRVVEGEGLLQELSIAQNQIAPEAFAQRTDEERDRIMQDMFGDETEEKLAQTPPETAAPQQAQPAAAEGDDLSGMFEAASPDAPATSYADDRQKKTYKVEAKDVDERPAILVVDDSSMARAMVCNVIEKLGYRAVQATDGIEAIVQARYHEPALIFLDIVMPGPSGLETLRELRQDSRFKATPIIMLTVESKRNAIQTAMSHQVSDYLIKPVKARDIAKRIEKYMTPAVDGADFAEDA